MKRMHACLSKKVLSLMSSFIFLLIIQLLKSVSYNNFLYNVCSQHSYIYDLLLFQIKWKSSANRLRGRIRSLVKWRWLSTREFSLTLAGQCIWRRISIIILSLLMNYFVAVSALLGVVVARVLSSVSLRRLLMKLTHITVFTQSVANISCSKTYLDHLCDSQ